MKLNKRITPLTIILILCIGFGGVVIGIWYWTSDTMTMTVSVTGYLDAKANVNPLTAWDGLTQVAYADLVEEPGFFDGSQVELEAGTKYIFVRLGPTNAQRFYTKVNAARPAGMSVSCNVSIVDRRDIGEYPIATHWHRLGPIALDGSQSMQLININGDPDPLYMLKEPADHMRYALYVFTVKKGALPPGDHTLSVEISVGDDLGGF